MSMAVVFKDFFFLMSFLGTVLGTVGFYTGLCLFLVGRNNKMSSKFFTELDLNRSSSPLPGRFSTSLFVLKSH